MNFVGAGEKERKGCGPEAQCPGLDGHSSKNRYYLSISIVNIIYL